MTQLVQKVRRWATTGRGLACLLVVLLGASARAADRETRDYVVRVDGKPAGNASITIQRQDDGTTVVTCNTNVRVKILIKTYIYTCQTQETWKNGRLQKLVGSCNDDGKQFQVSAAAQADGVHVRVNGREHITKPEVWVTSYWTLPDAKLRDQVIPVLEADNGREMQGRLQSLGQAQLAVAGSPLQNVQHYRLNGSIRVELYYDAAQRLVRRSWVEEGHPTELELVGVRR